VNLKADRDLEMICLKCLEKEPSQRYHNAEALAQDLDRFLEGAPVTARSLSEREAAWRWAKKHPVTAALTIVMVIATALIQLGYTAMSFCVVEKFRVGTFSLACAALLAGFVAVLAILVRPSRSVGLGVGMFLLVTLATPCLALAIFRAPDQPELLEKLIPGVPGVLFVALGLGIGVVLAGLFGGISRSIARRHHTDMLTVFFGGLLGAIVLTPLFGCVIVLPYVLVLISTHPAGNAVGYAPVVQAVGIAAQVIGCLIGFWLGGTLVARVSVRRLKRK
jgi:hypothetical protein